MPRAVVFGCAGTGLSPDERRFFAEADPLGFILFQRNCETPQQVRALVAELRAAVGRDDAPVLIDQEGGRVARLRPPYWRGAPAPASFGAVYQSDPARAGRAAWLNARLLAAELEPLGIDVDCTPVLDLRVPGAHDVIGDRAFGEEPEVVTALGRAVCDGLLAGGVLPVIKHLPGHGRAGADSHKELPVVETARGELERTDFAPFRELNDTPLGMTAHVVYTALDPAAPATASATVIREVIRGAIGFDGVLVSDDLSMQALAGDLRQRAEAALAAGCDLALHCNGRMREMRQVAEGSRALDGAAAARLQRAAEKRRAGRDAGVDPAAARRELDDLLQPA